MKYKRLNLGLMKYNEDAESEFLFTPLISNFRTLSTTSKLELELLK